MKIILLSAHFWTFFLLPKSTHSLSPSSTLRNNNNIKAAGAYNNKVFILDDQGPIDFSNIRTDRVLSAPS